MAAAASTSSDLVNVAEIVDHLITVPVFSGSTLSKKPVVLELYSAAREKFGGKPLIYDAFEKLSSAVEKSGSHTVVITTGFVVPPWIEAETDGPVGTATLARSLSLAWDLFPVIVTEPSSVPKMSSLMEYAGLRVKEFSKLKTAPRRSTVEGFTLVREEAKKEAERLISKVEPAAVIS